MALDILVDGYSDQKEETFELYIKPENPTEKFSEDAKVVLIEACFGMKGGTDYNNASFVLNCKEDLSPVEQPKTIWWQEWRYMFNVSEIKDQQWVTVYLKYKVPNFVRNENSLVTIVLNSHCFPVSSEPHCPKNTDVIKHIMLPPGTSPIQTPAKAKIQARSSGGWRITLQDFTPDVAGEQYSDIAISYLDFNKISEEKRNDFWINNVFTGIIIGIISTLLFEHGRNYFLKLKKIIKKLI